MVTIITIIIAAVGMVAAFMNQKQNKSIFLIEARF